ncbi:MAG: hypothetical protein ACYCW6_07835, partial [Candidatus Xenobia bacterium]
PPPLHHVFFIAIARYVESPQPQMPEIPVRFALLHQNGRLIPVEMQLAADGHGASSRFAVCVRPLN